MKFASRTRPSSDLPGVLGTARVDRRIRALLPRLREGDVAVIDHLDLDRATAQALVDAGVRAVLNASPMSSGRFPNLGPQVLADAGVVMVDRLGPDLFDAVREGESLRVDGGTIHAPRERVLTGEVLDAVGARQQSADARVGLAHQLDSFTHNSSEFLRREQDLLLHGQGVPTPATKIADRPVVVVAPGRDHAEELKAIRRFIVEQGPVLIGVDRGADALRAAGHRPDVIVTSARVTDEETPDPKTLKSARDVVLRVDRGASRTVGERFTTWGVQPLLFESSATTEDAALLLADAGQASVIVGVGMHATLDEFLDRQRSGLASTYLTRLKVGPRLVDATAVRTVYSGRVRPRHLLAVLLAAGVALAAAIGTTPVGQEWADALATQSSDLIDYLQGIFS
ncbi:putative cytokinetic ring protein SteA [Nocardioides gilvus]|uniref:putative cytokinetic ring protein SteA n=1 Tax=Nocardioides gilvus TaxID=1735589 RepID=UPI000D744754|nr:putative cytokinetic ring protein SteA [Nocardioides gilvus]